MITKETFAVIKLVQNLQESIRGEKNVYDPAYIEDVKKRMPNIEKAYADLKAHLGEPKE